MMFIDEGWKILNDDTFSGFLNDKLKTIRKLNGCVGFGTQSAKDIASSRMSHTLIEQTPTNVFFPNPKADDKSYLNGFKLTHAELAWVRETPPEKREFLIKHDNDLVIARLDLSGMPGLVKVLSSTPDRIEEMEAAIAKFGPEPKDWLPHFCGFESDRAFGRRSMRFPPIFLAVACLVATEARAQVPVADAARETTEQGIAKCMTTANASRFASVSPSQGTQGSMAAPGAANAAPTATVGGADLTGGAGSGLSSAAPMRERARRASPAAREQRAASSLNGSGAENVGQGTGAGVSRRALQQSAASISAFWPVRAARLQRRQRASDFQSRFGCLDRVADQQRRVDERRRFDRLDQRRAGRLGPEFRGADRPDGELEPGGANRDDHRQLRNQILTAHILAASAAAAAMKPN